MIRRLAAALLLALPAPALASDDAFELWFYPSVAVNLDEDTAVELQTSQRFRSSADGRIDTYLARAWLYQALDEQFVIGGALERRVNDGARNETRLLQDLTGRHGIWRTRIRFEQRFVDNADRMGLRVRPRLGIKLPLGYQTPLSFGADAELFVTLRSNAIGGDEGLTGLRTTTGITYQASEMLSLGVAYLRQQDFEDDGPDQIGHAPLITIDLTF